MRRNRLALTASAAAAVLAAALTGAASAGGSVPAPPAQPRGLDHFLCYQATAVAGVPTFKVPPGVSLLNQFSSAPFTPTFRTVSMHCNPALKVVTTATGQVISYPPASPSWHLLCFLIAGVQQPNSHIVRVTNQFGTGQLKTAGPAQFCLPSLKSTQTPPVFNPPGPNEIQPDHFTCYPVRYTTSGPRFSPPPMVAAGDQFDNFKPITLRVSAPVKLCVPTQKTVGGVVTPIKNPAAHLLCFAVSQTPVITPVWDQNQFGVGELSIRATQSLCLPSFKKLIK
jgi:hypothetical protein